MTTKAQPNLSGIEQAVAKAGTQAGLAALLKSRFPHKKSISQQAISQWIAQGYVPDERAIEVSEVTGVPVVDLVSPKIRALLLQVP